MSALVCLHGIGMGAAMFSPLGERIPLQTYSMPGYDGRPVRDQLTFEDLATDLVEMLDARGHRDAILFGHSIGGMIALETAIRHPDRVRALNLCCTTPRFGSRDGSFQKQFVADRLGPLDRGATMADLARDAVPALVGSNAPADVRKGATDLMSAVPPDAFRAAIRCLVTFDRAADLPDLRVPTLLIAGTEDTNAPARTMEKMAAAIPDSRFVVMDGGHLLPLEAPATLARHLDTFLTPLAENAA